MTHSSIVGVSFNTMKRPIIKFWPSGDAYKHADCDDIFVVVKTFRVGDKVFHQGYLVELPSGNITKNCLRSPSDLSGWVRIN